MKRAGRLFALPLMLLALLLQTGAAVAAARAQAEVANPFAAIPICSPNAPNGKAPPSHHGAGHCALCVLGAVAQPALLSSAAILTPDDLVAVASSELRLPLGPRGPPRHVPNARDPPICA